MTVLDSLIINNSAILESTGKGGGIAFGDSTAASIVNCTLSNNYARDEGGATYYFGTHNITIDNSILWNDRSGLQNNPSEVYVDSGSGPDIDYSNIQGGWTAPGSTGNINSDPLFCDAASNDYHWSGTSPCVDEGDNSVVTSSSDLDGNSRIVDGEVDMGAYEYQNEGCNAGGLTLADWLVDYLTSANPVDSESESDFLAVVDNLTYWVVDHFTAQERTALAAALSDPGLAFASQAGEDAANAVVAAIAP